MQTCVKDLYGIKFSSSTCYDTISTYDTCIHVVYDTSYDTLTMVSLKLGRTRENVKFNSL
jgi:hypothetical protein